MRIGYNAITYEPFYEYVTTSTCHGFLYMRIYMRQENYRKFLKKRENVEAIY